MSAEATLRVIESVGLVPVVRTRDRELALRASRALVRGGVGIVEITLTVPDALSVVTELNDEFSGRVVVGAGTVRTAVEAKRAVAAGAQFVVSPGLVPEVVEAALAADLVMMPGALTPSEVIAAVEQGSQIIKLFPCSALGGARYLKQLAQPLPHVKLLPTGGITLETVSEYISAGAAALGVGGELVHQASLARGEDDEITRRASAFLRAVRKARSEA